MSAAFAIARDMLTKNYDADLDHHMYFGQRLLYGELIWTTEIYDKFPLIQYLFAIPAYFVSVRVWFVMSAVMLLLSTSILYVAAPCLLQLPTDIFGRHTQRLCAIIISCFYLFFSTITPPSLNHINSITTSFFVIAFCFTAIANTWRFKNGYYIIFLHIFSTLFASFSISIRPFLAIPAASITFWLFFRCLLNFHYANIFTIRNNLLLKLIKLIFRSMLNTILWIIIVIFWFVTTNFVPYVITHNEAAMIEGIIHNAQKLNPQSPSDILLEQSMTIMQNLNWYYLVIFLTFFYVLLFGGQIIRKVFTRKYDKKLITYFIKYDIVDILFGVLVPLLGLELMILARHWWDHYWQMFVPLGIIHFIIMTRIIINQYTDVDQISTKLVRVVAVCAFAVGAVIGASANQEAHHAQEAKFKEITAFLGEQRRLSRGVDFLDIGDMYPHWQLSESRHGFPHAQNMQHIILGWYSSLYRMQHLIFSYTREELCHQVIERGPSVVFMTFSYMFSCLLSKESGYLLERNSWELIIFVRDPKYLSASDAGVERSLTK